MPTVDSTERFVQQLTGCQTRLLTLIAMLLGDPTVANDVLQETNMVLWRKAGEFDESRDFLAWAFGIARIQVLAHLRDARRDRHRFDDALIDSIAETAEPVAAMLELQRGALQDCLSKLSRSQRRLVHGRYVADESVARIAERTGHTIGSIAMRLSRIRQSLLVCIEQWMAKEQSS